MENTDSNQEIRAKVGEVIDNLTLKRLDKTRVKLGNDLTGQQAALFLPGFEPSSGLIQSDSSSIQGRELEVILNEGYKDLLQNPISLSVKDHQNFLVDIQTLSKLVQEGEMVPTQGSFEIEGGEEWVSGMEIISKVESLGLIPGDYLIEINGFSPTSYEKWGEILESTEKSRYLTFSYLRGRQVYYHLLETH